ncbi:small oligopeptide transporter [Auriscalpium vulgare]|uniref:Small oligopeptide transporter n=1 Tax=Auriscalpium vulgare TaxID=40419 RepID=A0ACB8S8F9_9AGAM|nr:small oligopeptide transporter [Auriscalpium vulgare]
MSYPVDEKRSSIDVEKLGDGPHDLDAQPVEEFDPNYDPTAGALEDESPYPEVRSAVANTDDPSMPVSTFRAWVFGLIWAILIPGVNQFFFFRYPSVNVSQIVPQLLTFPLCKLWARWVPEYSVFGMSINGGPFTIKEHVIVTIMAGVGAQSAYATDIIAVQRTFYGQTTNFGYQWLLVMSTQMIGFSIAGICKRFLVSPPSMIWPANLVTAALFNTLHAQETAGTKAATGMSRERFFTYVFVGYFFWNFLPTYLFTALSTFSWVCWIKPNNVTLNAMFGYEHGLAMGLITFDWGQIAYNGSPLPVPWWAAANIGIAVVFFYWFITPILYYTNVWYSAYLPIVSRTSFDRFGKKYNVTRIINEDASFNKEAYEAYSPLFISASFAVSYGLSFASITATLTHTFLYYRKQIWTQARRSLSEQPDIHARLMAVYPQVPDWWYAAIFLAMFVFGVVAIEVWNTQFPVWAFVLALIISFVYTVPIGVIQAITNQQVGLNVITELIIGYALPGKPIAMMMFKTWGYITMAQALQFTSDFKLGHYMKIPPRPMFWCQVVATVIAGTVQLAVQAWMFTNVEDMCSADQKDGFICPSTQVFGTASIIWGVIGPQRQFSHGQMYYGLVFFFLVGFLAPVGQYILHRRFKWNILKYLNFPLIFTGTGNMPPATPVNYIPWVLMGFLFNYVIRRRHFGWWSKYNYVLSAGLDAGYAVGCIIIFFALQYPKNGTIGLNSIQTWWGNTVYSNTADAAGIAHKVLADGEAFGPATW